MGSKIFLLITVALCTSATTAIALDEKPPAQWGYQYPPPNPDPSKAGYRDKKGNLYGNCKNYHHRPHKHCKELRDAAPTNNQPKR